jgi:hypothetical protein
MNAWSANVEDRQQIFIISNHKETNLSQSIEFSAILSTLGVCYQKPATGRVPYVFVFADFFAAKIMKRLVSVQSQSFFNI